MQYDNLDEASSLRTAKNRGKELNFFREKARLTELLQSLSRQQN
jgi:hypothetical protein